VAETKIRRGIVLLSAAQGAVRMWAATTAECCDFAWPTIATLEDPFEKVDTQRTPNSWPKPTLLFHAA